MIFLINKNFDSDDIIAQSSYSIHLSNAIYVHPCLIIIIINLSNTNSSLRNYICANVELPNKVFTFVGAHKPTLNNRTVSATTEKM